MNRSQLFLAAILLFLSTEVSAQSSQQIIKINQTGYYPNASKIGVLTANFSSDEYAGSHLNFYVLRANSSDTVYKNTLGDIRQSANSSTKTRMIDFSVVRQPG